MFFDPPRRVNGGCDRGRKAEATKIIEQTSQSDTVSGRKGFLERGRDLGSIWEAVQHPSKMLSDVTGTVGGPELSDNLTGGGSSPKNFPHFVKHSSFFRLHLILSVFSSSLSNRTKKTIERQTFALSESTKSEWNEYRTNIPPRIESNLSFISREIKGKNLI